MAQIVGYYENNVKYTEGPFVLVNAEGWRIETELRGHNCPVLPDASIYRLLDKHGLNFGKTYNLKKAEKAVDFLNVMVLEGEIVFDGAWHIWI